MYHVNPKTGNPGWCQAKEKCPFGGIENHYTSKEAAESAFAERMNFEFHESKTIVFENKREKSLAKLDKVLAEQAQLEDKIKDVKRVANSGVTPSKDIVGTIEKRNRMAASARKLKEKIAGYTQIIEAIRNMDMGEPVIENSHFSGERNNSRFTKISLGDVIETGPLIGLDGSVFRERGIVTEKNQNGYIVIHRERDAFDRDGFLRKIAEPEGFAAWSYDNISSIILRGDES